MLTIKILLVKRPLNRDFFSPETRSPYAAQASFKLLILLPHSPYSWDYRCIPPYTD
jgi:hypothetical protein